MLSTYSKVPYRGTIVPLSFPDHLAVCVIWCGGQDSSLHCFHLTELGCGDGTNLIALAFYHPDSTFIGIDGSSSELNRAREGAQQIGLRNIQFIHKDVRNIEPGDFAPSDYIIAHGLFSWVSEDARDAIFKFCQNGLLPTGLAYVSYNAQPGWANRRLVRETLLRSRSVQEAAIEDKANKAIEVATQLLEVLPSRDYAFAVLLAEELERVRDGEPYYVFHEYLEEYNEGFWLRDFVHRARQNGLDYVGDAQFNRWEGHIPKKLKKTLSHRDLDPIEQEETADLLYNRYFHASILCLCEAPRQTVSHQDILEQVFIASSLRAESDPFDLTEGVVEQFIGTHGQEITLDSSVTKAAVVLLADQWPAGMQLKTLFQKASGLLIEHGCDLLAEAQSQLTDELIILFEAGGGIDLRLKEPSYNRSVPDYPVIHALARYEISHREALTTPYHLPLILNAQLLEVACAMDNSKSIKGLKRLFGEEIVDQAIAMFERWGLLE